MSATIDLESAPADSTLGRANAVRRAYLALAEACIERIALYDEEDVHEDVARAQEEIERREDELRAHLVAQRKEDGY